MLTFKNLLTLKTNIMKKIYIYFCMTLMASAFIACSKSSDSTTTSVDYVAKAIGTYTGTVTYGVHVEAMTIEITKQTSSTVIMKVTDSTQQPANFPGVSVSDGGSGTVKLNLNNTDISGVVNGKSLDCYILGGYHFVGTKP